MRERFRSADSYRVDREWNRYEGTPQRDLFRELRERFLDRHRPEVPWVLEIGPGPGRFTARIGSDRSRRVLLDLSDRMLERAAERGRVAAPGAPPPDPVKGDGFRPPLRSAAFGEVAALGNVLGFAPEPFDASVRRLGGLVAPGGILIAEIVPGWGERSRYLARLPSRAVGRLLRSPVAAIVPRVDREGFAPVRERVVKEHGFHRQRPSDLLRALGPGSWSIVEGMAVAPALGFDPERIAAARPDPRAWGHLLEIEERAGRLPERWEDAAAVMVALRRSGPGGSDRGG